MCCFIIAGRHRPFRLVAEENTTPSDIQCELVFVTAALRDWVGRKSGLPDPCCAQQAGKTRSKQPSCRRNRHAAYLPLKMQRIRHGCEAGAGNMKCGIQRVAAAVGAAAASGAADVCSTLLYHGNTLNAIPGDVPAV